MPFFVVWCLSNKYYAMSMFFAFTQLVYFFVDGSKTTFFSLVIVVLAYLVLKKHPRLIREIILAFDAVTVACITQLIVLHGGIGKILSVFVRRVFFVPAKLNYDYYDYFSINPLNYYSNVIKFITPVYPKGVPAEIGFFRNGYYGESANNGLFSDAIANLGLVGCVVMPIAVVIVLKLFDVVSEGINEAVLVSVIIAVSRPLFGSSFFTGLITHGLLVMMLLLYCMPRNRWEKTHRIY